MSVLGQSPSIWCDVEAVVEDRDNCRMESDSSKIHAIMLAADKRETRNRDSGCDLSSAGTDSPSSYRWIKDDNSTGSYSCSSCEATVDQTSVVYQQLAETLAQARLNNSDSKETLDMPSSSMVVSESLIALNPIRPDDFKEEDNSMSMDYPDEKKQNDRLSNGSQILTFPDPSSKMETASRKSRGRLFPQVLASLALAIAALIEGYSSGYTSPALASMTQANSSIPVNDQQASWIGSLMPLNALIGGIVGGSIVEHFGRKTTIMATGPPYILSWLLITFATNLPMVYAGRSIQGFCVGLTTLTLPIYLGETIQPEVRGSLGLLPTTIGNIGILFCYILGSYIDWKVLAAIGAALPLPFLAFMWFIPETPRWYISKGRYTEARESLQWLRGGKTDVQDEFLEIENNYKNQTVGGGARELLKMAYLRPLLISLGLMFFQQLSGINAVIFYTVSIFEKSGGSVDSNLSSIIIGLANFIATLGSNMVIDRVGRKVLLNISGFFMAISLGALGVFFILQHLEHDLEHVGWLPLATFIVYIVAFSIGYGPIPWLMMGEIFPSKVRGHAASVATAFNWACSFAVTKFFNDLIATIGAHGAFWFFGFFCFISIFFVSIFVPETKGHSLENIEKRMMEKKPKKNIESTHL